MINMLILADGKTRTTRIKDSLAGWEVDAVLSTAEPSQIPTLASGALLTCDVVVLDHADPAGLRLEAVSTIRRVSPETKILIAGIPRQQGDDEAELIFHYLEAGAGGCVPEERLDADFVSALQEVMRGGTWLEPAMTARLIERTVTLHQALEMMKPYAAPGQDESLTRRQHEVLQLIAAGLTNQEIADRLFISVGTVKNHVHRILDTLRATSREQGAQYYQFLQAPSLAAT